MLEYMKHLYHDPNNSILLTGYQVEGSNGRLLMDEGRAYVDGNRIRFKGNIRKLDFSAHSGKEQLSKLIDRINPNKLVLMHGDDAAIESIRKEKENKCKVFTPKIGDDIDL